MSTEECELQDCSLDLAKIQEREPEAFRAIKMTLNHIAGTYGDKYAAGQNIIDTKIMLYDKKTGTPINVYQVNRYLQRYITSGNKKSYLINDLFKAIHYLVFEITRRVKLGEVDNVEHKI